VEANVETAPEKTKSAPVKAGKKCPECNGTLLIREGRNGKFISCVNFPGCKYTEPVPEDLIGKDCPECGKALVYRNGSNGRFIACSGFPQCKHSEPYFRRIGVKCPECGGDMVERFARKDQRVFYGCETYPACKYTSSYLPIADPCPKCGKNYLVLVGENRAHCRSCQADFVEKPAEEASGSST
jgi:DNA topoisomerase-1